HIAESAWPGLSLALIVALIGHTVDALLHIVELTLEIVHLAAGARRVFPVRCLLAGEREGPEQRKGGLKHLHIPPHLVLKRPDERGNAEGLGHLLAEFFL